MVRTFLFLTIFIDNVVFGSATIDYSLKRELERIINSFDQVPSNVASKQGHSVDLNLNIVEAPDVSNYGGNGADTNIPVSALPLLKGRISLFERDNISFSFAPFISAISFNGFVLPNFSFRYFSIGGSIVGGGNWSGVYHDIGISIQKNQARVRGEIVIEDETSGLDSDWVIETFSYRIAPIKWPIFFEMGAFRKRGEILFQLSQNGSLFSANNSDSLALDSLNMHLSFGVVFKRWAFSVGRLDYAEGSDFFCFNVAARII